MLGRDTEWRQADLLIDEQAHAMGLAEPLGSKHCVVLISHDCDLPNDVEICVEVIVGLLVQAMDLMFANARNLGSLHPLSTGSFHFLVAPVTHIVDATSILTSGGAQVRQTLGYPV